jgi:hypothetical protein
MAMRTASPIWFTALFVVGLVLIFMGERPFNHMSTVHLMASGIGGLMVLAITALRAWTFMATSGARRNVERTFLMCHIGVVIGLLLYVTTTGWGHDLLGIEGSILHGTSRWDTPMTVLWAIIIAVSVIPLLMVEFTLGAAMRTKLEVSNLDGEGADDASVEAFRVREVAGSGLMIALAAAFLMVTCNVAQQRDITRDVSYFRTSAPGGSTVNIVNSASEDIEVLLFFPEVNEVKQQVKTYFERLSSETGKIVISTHTKEVSAALAKEHRVTKDGTIVLVRGEKSKKITVKTDMKAARRTELRTFDQKVNAAVLEVIRAKRIAYMTVGHGELNDADSLGPLAAKYPDAKAALVKKDLGDLGYTVKDLGLMQGLGDAIPDDATMVISLAPRSPFSDEELAALDRYLAGGGALMLALDPMGKADIAAPLDKRLGVTFDGGSLMDDKSHLRQAGNPSDRLVVITNQFSSHESITTLSRGSAREGIVVFNAGTLNEVQYADGEAKPKLTHVIKSLGTSWINRNNNFNMDSGEKRAKYNLATAVEGTETPDGKDRPMRALVFADGELFMDPVQRRYMFAKTMFSDAIRWLGGEEHFAGETVSEKDVLIKHTKSRDVIWFYLCIVGAPLFVLMMGLGFVWFRRRRVSRRAA